jgi:hypothetical protein
MNCDDMATEWSYVYDCPNEKVEGVYRLAFCNCANADHYEPLCDTCHRKRDGKVSTTLRWLWQKHAIKNATDSTLG